GDESCERRAYAAAVVEDGEAEVELVVELADGEALAAGLAEQPPRARGERLALELRERLHAAEAAARAADEQDPGQLHVSLLAAVAEEQTPGGLWRPSQ